MDKSFNFRNLISSDIDNLFIWRNSPEVYRHFHNKDVTRVEHEKWFNQKVDESPSTTFIAVYNNCDSGVLQFKTDPSSKEMEISLYLQPEMQKKGLGSLFLKNSIEFAKKQFPKYLKINAVVLAGNSASKHIFEKNGFQLKEFRFEYKL